MRVLIALLMVSIALPAWATGDKHIPKDPLPPKTVYLERDSDHSREWTAALIGAGVTWFVMRRMAKRNAPPAQVIVTPSCPEIVPELRETRAEAECKK